MVKVTVCVVAPLTTVRVTGVTVRACGGAVTLTVVESDLPPELPVIVKLVLAVTVGAFHWAVAKPAVVCANGATEPPLAVKFTVVPSGTGVPAAVETTAEIVEVPPEATVEGSAKTVILLTWIGVRNNVITLNAPVIVETALTFTGVSKFLISVGTTLTRANACPAELVVLTAPSGKVSSELSAPYVTASPDTGVPVSSITVALTIASPVLRKKSLDSS